MNPKSWLIFFSTLALFSLGVLISADEAQYNPLQKEFYFSAPENAWISPGVNIQVLNVSIPAARKPAVTFRITDDKGQGLDRTGLVTPGIVTVRLMLSYIPAGGDQYQSYFTRAASSSVTGITTNQPTTDSNGTFTASGDGTYTYTFSGKVPSNYDQTVTHTVGIQASRDLREFGLSNYSANALQNFVPDGRPVSQVREVVATANCNQCHNPLVIHGSRRETGLCILCHTPQNLDPNTGNSLDLKVMVHKIHMGENLPSVKAGKPYQIGNPQRPSDFSDVTYPQDIRNCAMCHKDASQSDNWMSNPSRAACQSCHDDVDFKTGLNHPGGIQLDDNSCSTCHQPRGDQEYDASVAGAHTVPYLSAQLRNPSFEIVSVSNTGPGQKPTVQFRIGDKNKAAIAPSEMARLSLRLAGPSTDYSWYLSETATKAAYAGDIAAYTFSGSLPSDATGTYSVGIEGYLNTRLNPGTPKELTYRDAGSNVMKFFAVTGAAVTPRRVVVDVAKCNVCHGRLQLHGNSRNDPQYCVGCHNATMTDSSRRPASAGAGESIHFKVMIHRIHTGSDLTSDYTIWGGSPSNFNNVTFPGDRRDCSKCHVGNTYTLPIAAGALASVTPAWYWSPTQPASAACLGCHDSIDAAAHALLNTASFGESCSVCHKEGVGLSVSRVHAR